MEKKAITLEQLEEALRDLSRWIQDKLRSYIVEPAAEGKAGYVLTTNGAGGRSWEPGGMAEPDKTLSVEGAAADAKAVGEKKADKPAADGMLKAVDGELVAAAVGVDYQAPLGEGDITADMLAADAVLAGRLHFANVGVEASAFAADGTYEDFPYRAAVTLTGAKADMIPEAVLSAEDALSGNFAPVAESYDGGVYVYAAEKPVDTVTIPMVVLWR
ncbi:MAG: hypothetical protein IJE26_06750 [Oscillospiraceae bacterium]|nr:hypothetical protein [Oscillospiraceae bacterium]